MSGIGGGRGQGDALSPPSWSLSGAASHRPFTARALHDPLIAANAVTEHCEHEEEASFWAMYCPPSFPSVRLGLWGFSGLRRERTLLLHERAFQHEHSRSDEWPSTTVCPGAIDDSSSFSVT